MALVFLRHLRADLDFQHVSQLRDYEARIVEAGGRVAAACWLQRKSVTRVRFVPFVGEALELATVDTFPYS